MKYSEWDLDKFVISPVYLWSLMWRERRKRGKESPSYLFLRTFARKFYTWTSLICDLEWFVVHDYHLNEA